MRIIFCARILKKNLIFISSPLRVTFKKDVDNNCDLNEDLELYRTTEKNKYINIEIFVIINVFLIPSFTFQNITFHTSTHQHTPTHHQHTNTHLKITVDISNCNSNLFFSLKIPLEVAQDQNLPKFQQLHFFQKKKLLASLHPKQIQKCKYGHSCTYKPKNEK